MAFKCPATYLYEFLDFPMTSVSPWTYPTGAQVQAYIKAYKEKFVDGKVEVKLSTQVKSLTPRWVSVAGV